MAIFSQLIVQKNNGRSARGKPWEQEKMDENTVDKRKKKGNGTFRKIISIIVILLMAIIIGMFAWLQFGPEKSDAESLEDNVKAKLGQLEDKSNDEIQAALDEVIDEGSLRISINENPVFPTGDSEGTLKIENHPNNHYNIRVVITLNDTGEEIYNSGLMPINSHIETDTLERVLDKGEYDGMATFTAYDVETDAEVGQAMAGVRLSILN